MDLTVDSKVCAIEVGEGDAPPSTPSGSIEGSSNYVKFEPVVTQAEQLSSEEVRPLSRVQIAMVDNMTVKVGDTKTFTVGESINFKSVREQSKEHGVSPTTMLVKILAESANDLSLNKKLTTDKRSMRVFQRSVDIGVAVEVDGQLRVAVVRDASNKTIAEIAADIEGFKAKGSKLTPEAQDLDTVCYILTSLGKSAPAEAFATLPRSVSGILAVGRMQDMKSNFYFTLCHATLNGSEGANLLSDVAKKCEAR